MLPLETVLTLLFRVVECNCSNWFLLSSDLKPLSSGTVKVIIYFFLINQNSGINIISLIITLNTIPLISIFLIFLKFQIFYYFTRCKYNKYFIFRDDDLSKISLKKYLLLDLVKNEEF